MNLSEYTPHVIAGAALFLSIYLHWKTPKTYWRPTLVSGVLTGLVALVLIFVFQENYLNMNVKALSLGNYWSAIVMVFCLAFCYAIVVAALVGYVIKIAPSFFD